MKLDPVLPVLIQALTPLFLGSVGCIIGVAVLVTPGLSDSKWSAGFGLASTAIAAAAGLARGGGDQLELPVQNARDIASIRMQQENLSQKYSDATPDPEIQFQQSETITKQISVIGQNSEDPP